MIELIIAISIIVVALVSIVSLTIMNIRGQRINQNEIIAGNLSREGLEVMRNLRDSAFLEKKMIGADYMNDMTKHMGRVSWDTALTDLQAKFVTDIPENSNLDIVFADAATNILRDNATNLYIHQMGIVTPFKRIIILDYICADSASPDCDVDGEAGICSIGDNLGTKKCTDSNGDTVPDIIGYRVTSYVRWTERESTKNYSLVDYLYLWK